ncbi:MULTISPECIES: LPS-assembly lipoprotein LptE [Alkalimonas]|uniref:LPS-assembly lipoprotein LptE n=1 Tax=Alkalimonas mucilaginosa TaxID=3057676 RepID=A0ABU7JAP2_9GAMM|nr:LPS assembly lipoprotein LptE [Alkalimonas sp. MEB004]MEE2022771.1 LPS assembly lipoprotein LptE [Alkalimonas sp. MEB004]
MNTTKALRLLLFVVLAWQLTGCGFQLRGQLPLQLFDGVYLQAERHSELATILRQRLQSHQIVLLNQPEQDSPSVYLLHDSLERRTLSLFPNGQVAEYELIYQVRYSIQTPGAEAQVFEFELFRDYQDDPNRALAKARELELMLAELREQAAQRILRQLGRIGT